jgi:hypothetical protein
MMIAQQWGAWGGHFDADIVVFADSAVSSLVVPAFCFFYKRIEVEVETWIITSSSKI